MPLPIRNASTCSALATHQALAGTAPTAQAWVIFEYAGAWSREALSPETFAGDPLGADLLRATAFLESLGARVLLAREPGSAHAPLHRDSRAWLATAPDFALGFSTTGTVLDVADRSTAPALNALLDNSTPFPPTRPQIFICCHGKRDECCAVKGRALVQELRTSRMSVWECSHLGGHRFAPTALLFPHGGLFGRLTHESLISVLQGTSLGLDELRGIPCMSPAEQVVDIAAKKAWHLPWSANVHIEPRDSEGDHTTFVVSASNTRMIRCTVRRTEENLPMSCGKPASATTVWRVVDLREE